MENIEYIVESFSHENKTFFKHIWKKGHRTETILLDKLGIDLSVEKLAIKRLKYDNKR